MLAHIHRACAQPPIIIPKPCLREKGSSKPSSPGVPGGCEGILASGGGGLLRASRVKELAPTVSHHHHHHHHHDHVITCCCVASPRVQFLAPCLCLRGRGSGGPCCLGHRDVCPCGAECFSRFRKTATPLLEHVQREKLMALSPF